MPARMNGGVVIEDGQLTHYIIVGADFSGTQDINGQPVYNSAAAIIVGELSKQATIALVDPVSQPLGMSIALETNRADWTAQQMQDMIRGLGSDVGEDHLNLSSIVVEEVPYDLIGSGFGPGVTTFIDLYDTPTSYIGHENEVVVVNSTGTGLTFAPSCCENYIDAVASQTFVQNKKYIVRNSMTCYLPDYSTLVIGDVVTVARPYYVVSALIQAQPAQIIRTNIGSDNAIDMDIATLSLFIYDGTSWTLCVEGLPG